MKKILFASCHEILEFDEVSLLTELGYDVFSMGAFSNPQQDGITRPQIKGAKSYPHLHAIYLQCSKENIHPELIEWADAILMMHNSRVVVSDHHQPWLGQNWEKMKDKPVIWRSIGQSNGSVEESLQPFRDQGLKIVRYSPKEKNIPGYVGEDAMIRFYKDPEEFRGWTGEQELVITIGQSMRSRGKSCNYRAFLNASEPFGRRLYGIGNEDTTLIGGQLSYADLKTALRDNRVYFYSGTQPAPYTLNFIEALMTGIPVVAIGESFYDQFPEMDTYEIPDILENGKNGFYSNDIPVLQEYIKLLMDDYELAKKVSKAGREKAIELFGKEKIKEQWKDFLEEVL